jgi:Flp pilus assembly protein TadG
MNGNIPSRVRNDESGQTLIESALVFGFLIILVIGMLEMSLFLYNYAVLTDAAKEGVRYAVVHGSSGTAPASSDDINNNAVQPFLKASVHEIPPSSVTVNYPDGSNAPGNRVQVTVSYLYDPLFLKAPEYWATVTVSATSVGRIQF